MYCPHPAAAPQWNTLNLRVSAVVLRINKPVFYLIYSWGHGAENTLENVPRQLKSKFFTSALTFSFSFQCWQTLMCCDFDTWGATSLVVMGMCLLVSHFTVSLTVICHTHTSVSLHFSPRFIPLMLMDTPPPRVYLIKNQLKTPRRQVSRAKPSWGWKRNASRTLSPSLSPSHCISLYGSLPLSPFFLQWYPSV